MLFAPQSSWKHTPFMLDSCLVKLRVYRLQYWPEISPLLEAGRGAKKLGQTKLKSTYTIPISNWSKMLWSFVSSLSVKMETLHLLDNHVTSFIHDHISLIRPIWSLRTMETQIIAAVKLSVRGFTRIEFSATSWSVFVQFTTFVRDLLYTSERERSSLTNVSFNSIQITYSDSWNQNCLKLFHF